jgi:hypothetical protein
VINQYFDEYFPRAAAIGAQLRSLGGPARLKWMTQSYLVSLFLDCPPGIGLHCPALSAVTNFTAAVAAGDIVWQAFPHNAELMMLDKLMLQFGIEMVSKGKWVHQMQILFGCMRWVDVGRDVLYVSDGEGMSGCSRGMGVHCALTSCGTNVWTGKLP